MDDRFYTPMVDSDTAGHIFVNDFVSTTSHLVKVKSFFQKVLSLVLIL